MFAAVLKAACRSADQDNSCKKINVAGRTEGNEVQRDAVDEISDRRGLQAQPELQANFVKYIYVSSSQNTISQQNSDLNAATYTVAAVSRQPNVKQLSCAPRQPVYLIIMPNSGFPPISGVFRLSACTTHSAKDSQVWIARFHARSNPVLKQFL